VRTPRGRDIMAACGQLRSLSLKTSARERAKEAPKTQDAGAN
jgi:23S rRNA (adenine2503-C2)-methyltransferase